MKSLLNITVFASAVLSIFSTTLTLYEVPELKEALSVMEEDKSNQESEAGEELRRIYISHDVSSNSRPRVAPVLISELLQREASSSEESFNVFGVNISKAKSHRNI